jgi:hypothetical protein
MRLLKANIINHQKRALEDAVHIVRMVIKLANGCGIPIGARLAG